MGHKKHLKTGLIVGIVVLFMGTLMWIVDLWTYPIEPDLSNLDESITDFYNRGYRMPHSPMIQVYDSVTFGKKKVLLIEINEDLGRVLLTENLLGRYKIEKLGYGGGDFRSGTMMYDGKKYLLFGGRNTSMEITDMAFTLSGKTYHLEIPSKPRFLVYGEIDPHTEEAHLNLDEVILYNAQGQDITDRYDLSGGGI